MVLGRVASGVRIEFGAVLAPHRQTTRLLVYPVLAENGGGNTSFCPYISENKRPCE